MTSRLRSPGRRFRRTTVGHESPPHPRLQWFPDCRRRRGRPVAESTGCTGRVLRGLTSGVKPVNRFKIRRAEPEITGVVGVKDRNANRPSEGNASHLKPPRHRVAVATGGVGPRGQVDRIPREPLEATRPMVRRKCSSQICGKPGGRSEDRRSSVTERSEAPRCPRDLRSRLMTRELCSLEPLDPEAVHAVTTVSKSSTTFDVAMVAPSGYTRSTSPRSLTRKM